MYKVTSLKEFYFVEKEDGEGSREVGRRWRSITLEASRDHKTKAM